MMMIECAPVYLKMMRGLSFAPSPIESSSSSTSSSSTSSSRLYDWTGKRSLTRLSSGPEQSIMESNRKK
jgi:hypothetical protein